MRLASLALSLAAALILVGCTTSGQIAAEKKTLTKSARGVVGTDLIGAKGKTRADTRKITVTAARLCGVGVWTKTECAEHQRQIQ